MASKTIIVLLLLFSRSTTKTPTKKIDANVDIVVILSSAGAPEKDQLAGIKEAYLDLADHFVFKGKARFAAVTNLHSRNPTCDKAIVVPLTTSKYEFTTAVHEWTPFLSSPCFQFRDGYMYDFVYENGFAFTSIISDIFKSSVSDRARIVYFVVTEGAGRSDMEALVKLRAKDAWIYTIAKQLDNSYYHEWVQSHDASLNTARAYAAKKHRILMFEGSQFQGYTDQANAYLVGGGIYRDLCGWQSMWRFVDSEQECCEWDAWKEPSKFLNDASGCYDIEPFEPNCSLADCLFECAMSWPRIQPTSDCDDKNCGVVFPNMKRVGEKPPNSKLEYCPMTFKCPPCEDDDSDDDDDSSDGGEESDEL